MIEKGQVIIILLLSMLVALTIGLSIIENSISDISTATKVEQSSRAFSAAEAGLERALLTASSTSFNLDNESKADVSVSQLPVGMNALEYPPITRADFAHFWLANPDTLGAEYEQSSFKLYIGNCDEGSCPESIKPAVEVIVVAAQGNNYSSERYYFDSDATRVSSNNFTLISGGSNLCSNQSDLSPMGSTSKYYCRVTINYSPSLTPILARVRILYSTTAQRVALEPLNNDPLPAQARIYTSIGTSGQTQRKLTIFREREVVLPFFDFAIYSEGDIIK